MSITIISEAFFNVELLMIAGLVISMIMIRHTMKSKFPKYQIIYERVNNIDESRLTIPDRYKERMGKFTQHHHLYLKNLTDNEIPSLCKVSYATPLTYGFKKLPLDGKTGLTKGKGEKEEGWYPYFFVEEVDKRHVITSSMEPIIWVVKYKSKFFWHCSYELFDWNSTNWKPIGWDGYYTEGIIAWFLLLGRYFRNEPRRQIKRWKKEEKKREKENAFIKPPTENM